MPADPVLDAEPGWLDLPASLDLTGAEALRGALLPGLLESGGILLDGRAVERVTTPCLQVLAAAAATARARALPFRLRGVSVALAEAIEDLGLSDAIPHEV